MAARIPVRTNRDDRYFSDTYQVMPRARLHAHVLAHAATIRISDLMLNTDYREIREDRSAPGGDLHRSDRRVSSTIGLGKLPYRSLEFRFETHHCEQVQPVATINYPNDYPYTRVTEFKYLTGQEHPRTTTLVYEYPKAEGDPYYPIPAAGKCRALPAIRGAGGRAARRAFHRPAGHLSLLQHGPGGGAVAGTLFERLAETPVVMPATGTGSG